MVNRRDYTAEAVEACKSVLLELLRVLGEFRDQVVLVGGWVPGLLLRDAPERHVGTLDVDLAVDVANLPEETYESFLRALEARGYRQDKAQPFRFYRDVPVPGGAPIVVEVDFLAGEYGGTGPRHRTQAARDIRARKARGCDLVFENSVKVTVEGRLPAGGVEKATVRVAGIVPWLVMKGMALADRIKEKDAYDIVYVIRHYPGSRRALAIDLRPHLDNFLVREGLGKIRSKFASANHWGPIAVADFLGVTEPEERAITTRRAYEEVTALLDELGIPPWP